MKLFLYPDKKEWKSLLERPQVDFSGLFEQVKTVLDDIKQNGDKAVMKYTKEFDKTEIAQLQVTDDEINSACLSVSSDLKEAILRARRNIEKFHLAQMPQPVKVETEPGVTCWQKAMPIEKVGLYVPGGSAPLFSTVLMLAIPAKLAGCKEIVLCTPPNKEGEIHPAILYAASLCGVEKIYKVGGMQAIGAMAYGTETIPQVYKIFGPGNRFVTAAKQLLSLGHIAIDMPAGPSEVEVLADESAHPTFIAADLLSQAEHGADSQAILITNYEALGRCTIHEVERLLAELPRKDIATKAIENSKVIVLKSEEEMIEMTNLYAPEHLIISMRDDETIANKISNAGSIFLGNYTPESAGDYASGTNHTLPTHGFAKTHSGVNMDSFMKKITYQKITPEGLKSIGPAIELMATNEELEAHKNAVTVRLHAINNPQPKFDAHR